MLKVLSAYVDSRGPANSGQVVWSGSLLYVCRKPEASYKRRY